MPEKLNSYIESAVNWYKDFEGLFTRHCKIDLIEYLIKNDFKPNVIGVSKLSCTLCSKWIEAVNSGNVRKWKVTGSHGRM